MTSLYNLIGERLALQRRLESLDFDSETIEDTLTGDGLAIQAKVEAYAFIITNMEALPESIKAEEKRLADRRKAIEKRIENIKHWLFVNMQAAGISRIEAPIFTIAIQNNPPSVVIDDEYIIPADYWRVPPAPAPVVDKILIAKAIKDGVEVAGAHLQSTQKLVIR